MDAKKIGKILRELRGTRSLNEVAGPVGIATTTLSMYENGERIPRDVIKIKLAEFYGKTVLDIFYTN